MGVVSQIERGFLCPGGIDTRRFTGGVGGYMNGAAIHGECITAIIEKDTGAISVQGFNVDFASLPEVER